MTALFESLALRGSDRAAEGAVLPRRRSRFERGEFNTAPTQNYTELISDGGPVAGELERGGASTPREGVSLADHRLDLGSESDGLRPSAGAALQGREKDWQIPPEVQRSSPGSEGDEPRPSDGGPLQGQDKVPGRVDTDRPRAVARERRTALARITSPMAPDSDLRQIASHSEVSPVVIAPNPVRLLKVDERSVNGEAQSAPSSHTGGQNLAAQSPNVAAREPSRGTMASLSGAQPAFLVSIGRIEIEVAPAQKPPSPARVERTRGFDAYARVRLGRLR